MFNLIPLGRTGWKMAHMESQVGAIGQRVEANLPWAITPSITPTPFFIHESDRNPAYGRLLTPHTRPARHRHDPSLKRCGFPHHSRPTVLD